MVQPWYATREQVKRALDSAETARNNAQIDRALTSASRSIEGQCHRKFYPYQQIRYFGFRPWQDGNSSWRLWLNENDLISVSSLVVGGTTISSADYFLEPINSGPPYTSIEMDLSSNAVFATGDTWQRTVVITGNWGYWAEQEEVGILVDYLDTDASDTATITWTKPEGIGVGSILKIDTEFLIVTEILFADTSQNTTGSLTASAAANTVGVASGAGFYIGETIRIDSEAMRVVDIQSNNLIVKRAWDGTVLAAHNSSADVYGKTAIQVDRAQLGSSLSQQHEPDDIVYRYIVPPLINDLCVAEAVVQLKTELHGYARGEGELATRPAVGGLRALREQVEIGFARRARVRTI